MKNEFIIVGILIFGIGWSIGMERYSFNNIRNFGKEKIIKETVLNTLSVCSSDIKTLEWMGFKHNIDDNYQKMKEDCINLYTHLMDDKQYECVEEIKSSTDKKYYNENLAICFYHKMEALNIIRASETNQYHEENDE